MGLKEELIAAITDENLTFDMSLYCARRRGYDSKLESEPMPTCQTARCMAGHIEALRPTLAAQFADELGGMTYRLHAVIADKIWRAETGEVCRLDFLGENNADDLEDITSEEAVDHILGKNSDWPQLADDQLLDYTY